MSLSEAVESYHRAADEFSRGNPELVKDLFSHEDDVTLANPFGPAVRGWDEVAAALEFASSQFRDGEVSEFETIASYVSEQVATVLELERWNTKVAGRDEPTPFALRVTSTFRRENGAWRLVHRHADPIVTPDPDGPLRTS